MDSEAQTSRPSAMERITAKMEERGTPRYEKIERTLKRILGAEAAIPEAMTIAGENARELQLRTADRFNESARWLENEITSETNRLGEQMTKLKDGAVATAKGWAERALKFGLTKATAVEDRVVAIFSIPADITEKVAGVYEAKAESDESRLISEAVKMAASEAKLSDEQKAIIQRIMEAQAAQREKLSAKHELRAAKVQDKIEITKGTASELKAKAGNVRAGVEKLRVFKGRLARMSA